MKIELNQSQVSASLTGYLHPRYAESLSEFGTCRELTNCGGWILERNITNSPFHDAMGCYPLFSCRDWERLPEDLVNLEGKLVSLAIVTDPFGNFQVEKLFREFDICFQYKEHFVADLSRPIEKIVAKGHRRYAQRALRKLVVEICLDPFTYSDEWTWLYSWLTKRHNIQGIRRFSKVAFESQLRVPGIVYFRVLLDGYPVGGNIFYLQNNVAYGHLSAFTDEGYSSGAAYAVKWTAIEYFFGKAAWMSLGAGAGVNNASDNGLAYFKLGWAPERRPVYFCGRILDREAYLHLASTCAEPASTYFPIYRDGEFT